MKLTITANYQSVFGELENRNVVIGRWIPNNKYHDEFEFYLQRYRGDDMTMDRLKRCLLECDSLELDYFEIYRADEQNIINELISRGIINEMADQEQFEDFLDTQLYEYFLDYSFVDIINLIIVLESGYDESVNYIADIYEKYVKQA